MSRESWYIPLHVPFLETLVDRFVFEPGVKDYSQVCVVFPGLRPSQYLHRRLLKRIAAAFVPPSVLSIEQFVHAAAESASNAGFRFVTELEALAGLYAVVSGTGSAGRVFSPAGRQQGPAGFFELHPWLVRLLSFIDQSDVENIPDKALADIGLHADLGFDLPEGLNALFRDILEIRTRYHAWLAENGLMSRGTSYLRAVEAAATTDISCLPGFACFGKFVFAGLFGLTSTERLIIGRMIESGKSTVVWHGEPSQWNILGRNEQLLGISSSDATRDIPDSPYFPARRPAYTFHASPDFHTEAEQLHGVLSADPGLRGTVVVLPDSDSLLPALSFCVDRLPGLAGFNVSLDYPFSKTPVFSLVKALSACHLASRNADGTVRYRAAELVRLLGHPFVKNMSFDGVPLRGLSRALSILLEDHHSPFYSSPYLEPSLLAQHLAENSARGGGEGEAGKDGALFPAFRKIFLDPFSAAETVADLCKALDSAFAEVVGRSAVASYVLSGEIFGLCFGKIAEILDSPVAGFPLRDPASIGKAWGFVLGLLEQNAVHFDTRPLQDLEVLGMLETRNLDFKRVCVLDVQEGVLPPSRKIDPLIPLELLPVLGLPSSEDREEIYRYYFFRLISSAERVDLFYQDKPDSPRSRFIEQILWEEEKREGRIIGDAVRRTSFPVKFQVATEHDRAIPKTPEIVGRLSSAEYPVTDIDLYLFCQVRFYYRKVLGLRIAELFSAEVAERDRGTIVHDILEGVFRPFVGRWLGAGDSYAEVMSVFETVFEEKFRDRIVSGEYFLFRELSRRKLRHFLDAHLNRKERFNPRFLEYPLKGKFEGLTFKAKVDRIDEFKPEPDDGLAWRIVDYKTGGVDKFGFDPELAAMETVSTDRIRETIPSFQVFLYHRLCLAGGVAAGMNADNTDACLVSVKKRDDVNYLLSVAPSRTNPDPPSRAGVGEYYERLLGIVLAEMLDPDAAFRKYPEDVKCEFCEFNACCKYR